MIYKTNFLRIICNNCINILDMRNSCAIITPTASNNAAEIGEMEMTKATYDYSKFEDCVARGMFLAEKAIEATGQQAVGCKWAIEQAIINRNSGETMMTAVIRYIDGLEYRLEQAAGIVA